METTEMTDEPMLDLGENIPTAAPRRARANAGAAAKAAGKVVSGPKLTRIILEENDDIPPTGLFVQHNGRPFVIRTGIEVDVPPEILNILNDAVASSPVKDPGTGQVVGYRDRMKYPYRRVS